MMKITSSGSKAVSAGANILADTGLLHGFSLSVTSADGVLSIYDNSAGDTSGTLIAVYTLKASSSSVSEIFNNPVWANKGISYVLTGTGATAIVYYSIG